MSEFPRRLWWFSGAVLGVALGVAAVLAAVEGRPPVAALLVFAALAIFSEHQPVQLRNGMYVSAGFMVQTAALVVFAANDAMLGTVLVGLASALYIPSLRHGPRGWVVFNAGLIGCALVAAALIYATLPDRLTADMPLVLLAPVLPTLAYLVVATVILAASYVIDGTRRGKDVVRDIRPMMLQAIPFALLGFFLGRLYLELGAAVVVFFVVPILIAREVFASYIALKDSHEETVRVLISALEAKDRYTAGHAERVAKYAEYVGEELRFTPGRMERLRFAALMHDIGKLIVPNHLLNKPGKLTAEEFARVRLHEAVSVSILSHIDFLRPVAAASHSDHTRFDPDDPKHPIEPYIVMAADAYDAMTSTRSYRKALPQDVAFGELRDKAGTQFHPRVVEALIAAIERREEHHGAGHEPESVEHADAPEAGIGSAGLGDLAPSGGDAEATGVANGRDGAATEPSPA